MARNGSGTMSIVNTFVAGNTITAAGHNQNNTDIAAEITNSVAVDGQSVLTGQLKAASGTVSLPGYTFGADLDCGWYRIGANNLGLALNGAKVVDYSTTGVAVTGAFSSSGAMTVTSGGLTITAGGQVITAGQISHADGTTGAPSYSFTNDLDSGLYRVGANNFRFACNAADVLDIGTNGLVVTGAISASTSVTATTALSGATAAGAMVATQAQQETATATNLLVSPGRQHFHPGMAKGWAEIDASAGLEANYNVSSITDVGAGQFTVNWGTDFSGGFYNAQATAVNTPSGAGASTFVAQIPNTMAAGTTGVATLRMSDFSAQDASHTMVTVFGDHA